MPHPPDLRAKAPTGDVENLGWIYRHPFDQLHLALTILSPTNSVQSNAQSGFKTNHPGRGQGKLPVFLFQGMGSMIRGNQHQSRHLLIPAEPLPGLPRTEVED